MALKFLNKKGWHTGSLRNIENVWKAEQKHDAEQKKLEELRKQIHEERERSEFRQLQEQAGLVPRQERLEFLYDSGLAVGRTTDQGSFKALEVTPKPSADAAESSAAKQAAAEAPGALFEEKPQSANDAWRKLHSDPLLLIRQREQEALARVKNNPVQMAMIRKSIESKSKKEKDKDLNKKDHKAKGRDRKEHKKSRDKKEHREKHHHNSSKHRKYSSSRQESDSDDDTGEDGKGRKSGDRSPDRDKHYHKNHTDSESDLSERDGRSKKSHYNRLKDKEHSPKGRSDSRSMQDDGRDAIRKNRDKYSSEARVDIADSGKERENKRFYDSRSHNSSATEHQHEARHKRRHVAPRLSEEERAARLREMQMDAEEHEEQRWKRLKKAEDDDAREAAIAKPSGGRNFLDAAHKSVYGAGKGGSATISESVRRRTHYLQGRSEANEGNAFRR